MAKYATPEVDNLPIPTESRSNRFPEDQELRRGGFRIHARPRGAPAVWERRGELYAHAEALAVYRAEQKRLVRGFV